MTLGRITNQMLSEQMLANINRQQNALQTTQQQLSSGKRINQPSDDPYGSSLAITLNGQIAHLSDLSSNVSDGTAWTSAGLSSLSSITQQLQRAQELVTSAQNGTQSASDLQADGAEINQLIDGIKSDADAQYNGQYVFAGSAQSTTPPYASGSDDTYAGDSGAVTRTVGPNSTVTVNVQLSSVLNGPGGNDGLLAQLRSIATSLNSGAKPDSSSLTDLGNSLNALTQQSATLGAAADRLQLAGTRISSLQTSTTSALSDDQDADYAATLTAFSSEQTAYEAALKAGASIVQTSLMDFLGQS